MEYLISCYIDNELDLDEKIHFVEEIHNDESYKDDAISLLEQEKILHTAIIKKSPAIAMPVKRKFSFFPVLTNATKVVFAVSLFIIFSFLFKDYLQKQPGYEIQPVTATHRFVIYQDGIQQAEIAGSFTNWKRLPLQPAGTSGYWETTLQLPEGEHRYIFILDGNRLLTDPTVSAKESDDYGSTNSIISIGA